MSSRSSLPQRTEVQKNESALGGPSLGCRQGDQCDRIQEVFIGSVLAPGLVDGGGRLVIGVEDTVGGYCRSRTSLPGYSLKLVLSDHDLGKEWVLRIYSWTRGCFG